MPGSPLASLDASSRPGTTVVFADGSTARASSKDRGRHPAHRFPGAWQKKSSPWPNAWATYLFRPISLSEAASSYQTVYADKAGSVAAPTAELHFAGAHRQLKGAGVDFATVTLHVGLGFLRPMAAETLSETRHAGSEWFEVASLHSIPFHSIPFQIIPSIPSIPFHSIPFLPFENPDAGRRSVSPSRSLRSSHPPKEDTGVLVSDAISSGGTGIFQKKDLRHAARSVTASTWSRISSGASGRASRSASMASRRRETLAASPRLQADQRVFRTRVHLHRMRRPSRGRYPESL